MCLELIGVMATTYPAPVRFDDPTSEAEVHPNEPGTSPPERGSMLRALRELEAAKARVERDAARVLRETRIKLVTELLPVADNLDRTIATARQQGDAPTVVQGATMVRAQLESVLKGYGVERIDASGAAFDPMIHEAVGTVGVTDPRDHGRVAEQMEPGYRMGERLLRPAKVIVAQRPRRGVI